MRLLLLLVLPRLAAPLAAQQPDSAPGFDLTEVMIPARDGVKLHTTIFVPRDARGPLPIIFTRTPYGIAHAGSALRGYYRAFAADGYSFAFQDIRGRYTSEGQFVMLRPPRPRDGRDPKAIDESTDAYDTIDWLLAHVPNNNGRVGMLGISYPGWLTLMAMLDPHPALKAASPQASPADMFLGDDFHHNGAFRLSYGFEYAARMETSKQQETFEFDRYDTFQWYLDLGPLANVNTKHLHGKIPTWNDFVAHPNYDAFWQRQGAAPYLTRVTVPTLTVAGWWDQEDFYGPLKIYELLEPHDTGDEPRQPEAITFEAGANQWRSWDAWPPRQGTTERLYFQPGGRLSFEAPTGANAFDSYVSDPAHPVPYRHRPIPATYSPQGSGWPTWLVEDQRFVDERPDVLTWQTEPLTEDVTIAGAITARLFVATTGTDGDWIVKLIDVYPEQYPKDPKLAGWELMVANDVLRARFRSSFVTPAPLTPNQVTPLTIDLHSQDYRFLKGHRVMVQVQSSWFPLIDRNPQTFVPSIFEARASDYRPATVRVYRSVRWPSSIEVQVVKD